ncbi:probable indole-3-pyruvate monooxygenase YUCCA11 [Lolium rigidum]|uniref:probable indole-3-pyruvate monooxygenase YUCCA11 n=1 Tax=Lolium rigidum TaxID=89674 RepID=UPI001F5DB17F|nr:probable indole-3-pyruvate monooxygenase YUCCA11 [Lolium rigidum]
MAQQAAEQEQEQEEVIIVGAGPSGLAAAACLSLRGVRSLVLERDGCVGSLWRNRTYDRVRLHLAKQHCALPHLPHDAAAPTYLPRDDFVRYLDGYAARFGVRTRLGREVQEARFDEARGEWVVEALDRSTGKVERYAAKHLVAAAGENDEKVVPEVPGLEGFPGKVMHACEYRTGKGIEGKAVLVVGSGNSGMEIAYDLAVAGAATSIIVRSELHLVTKEIWNVAMTLYMYLPLWLIDRIVLLMCHLVFGDTSRYGLRRPAIGPFTMKITTPAYPVVDVGTYAKIRTGEIQVLPEMRSVQGNVVEFTDGKRRPFDAIVFATGYRSTTKQWLKSDDELIGEDGMARRSFPGHWKGKNGLYCAGMVRRGLYGSCEDAEFIAEDISSKKKHQTQPDDGHEKSN